MTRSIISSGSPSPAEMMPLGAYIFYRLREIGIEHVFGCPGDFNLNLLDHLYTVPSMKWVGTCNELNGAYAADGYARVRGIPGALITTYGVGELSAINGIAGAYSEHVPIIHIVGTTSRQARRDKIMIHHTLDENWDHDTFQRMSEPVRTGQAFLLNDATFTKDVDAVIEKCVKSRRPVYLYIPMDTPDILVDSSPLSRPLNLEIRNEGMQSQEDEIIEEILTMLTGAKRPAILADVLAHRYGAAKDVSDLLDSTGFPAFVTPLSKSIIDETHKQFMGLYNGELTPKPSAKRKLEESDAIIHIGPLPSDSNTGGWTQKMPEEHLIYLGFDKITIRGRQWNHIHFLPILKRLVSRFRSGDVQFAPCSPISAPIMNGHIPSKPSKPTGPLEQRHFWNQFSPFLQPNDCIIAEVGSAQYGTLELDLPPSCTYFTQIFYSCIGFTVGALLGALVARREQGNENKGRCILFVGDGSLHMTVQELSTIIRHGFHPTIVLINNSGYTIERVIHGPTQQYNDISESWDYQNMLNFFGARSPGAKPNSYAARTYSDLSTILSSPSFMENLSIQLLEAFMDKFDSPWMLTRQINIVQEHFGKMQAEEDARKGRKRKCLDTNLYKSKYNNTGLESTRYVMDIEGQGEKEIAWAPVKENKRTEKVAWRAADLISEKSGISVRLNGYEQWGI